jgi:uncharacterized membrane protein YgcG
LRNRHRVLLFAASVVWLSCLILGARSRALAASFPERPPAGVFHVDKAGILGSGEAHEINLIAGSLLATRTGKAGSRDGDRGGGMGGAFGGGSSGRGAATGSW